MIKFVQKIKVLLKSIFTKREPKEAPFYMEHQLDLSSLERPVTRLFIHCADTPPKMDIGVKEIREWHVKDNGWKDIGYHWVIRRNGTIEDGRPINQVGAHVKGWNTGSLAICLVGGRDNEANPTPNFTPKQWHTLEVMVRSIKAQIPHIGIHGHNEFDAGKDCPSFSVQDWIKNRNI